MSAAASAAALARLAGPLKIFIAAGEPSGDVLAARVMAALRAAAPCAVDFCGVGGPRMRQERLQQVFPAEDLGVMGVFELLPHVPRLALRLRTAAEAARAWKPHCVLTVDYKGFNLRLQRAVRSSWPAGTLRPAGVQLVSPSVWAFRGGEARARCLAHAVDEVLCILPFEPPMLQRAGVAATFVGHPVLEDCEWRDGQWRLREALVPPSSAADGAAAPLLCVLLGSREQEVARHAPLFGDALLRLRERTPGLRLLLPTLPPLRAAVAAAAEGWGIPFEMADGADAASRYAAFSRCRAALAVSGSVTAQLAAARLPAVVAYRAHQVTEWLAARRAAVRHVALPNLVLRREATPELVFDAATPAALAERLGVLLADARAGDAQRDAASEFLSAVAPPECSAAAADAAVLKRPSRVAAEAVLRRVGAHLAAFSGEEPLQ